MAEPDSIKIPLLDGTVALVDADDAHLVQDRDWRVLSYSKHGEPISVVSGGGYSRVLMHRVIAQPPDDLVVDHINGNALDNRRKNLRLCTQAENLINRRLNANNRSGYKGVHLDPRRGKYRAEIRYGGNKKFLGYFESAEDAAAAYKEAADKYHGSFVRR